MSNQVATFGEILMRLSPPGNQRFLQTQQLDINFGGAEANVAVALSNFGVKSRLISKVPNNDFAQAAINKFRSFGVDTDFITRGGERIGVYFLENGTWARHSKVIYDRKNSALSQAEMLDFDFDKALDGIAWLHTTGITPAISDRAAELTLEALKCAKEKGITTSFDINFRASLWNKEKAKIWLTRLCEYVDVYIGNIGHAELLLDVDASDPDNYQPVFEALKKRFGFKQIACTIRESRSASLNHIGAVVYDGENAYRTKEYDVEIVDRVGSGDSFSAGLIYGLINGQSIAAAAEFGVAASALKHTIPGDMNLVTKSEVASLAEGDIGGQVVR